MTQYADADELLAMYTFDDDDDLNERGHVPLPVIRENIKDCIVPDVEKKLRDCDILAGLLYMMGKITNVVTEVELKKFITERTGMSEEAYKAIDDIIAKEYEEADNKPLICEAENKTLSEGFCQGLKNFEEENE